MSMNTRDELEEERQTLINIENISIMRLYLKKIQYNKIRLHIAFSGKYRENTK